MDQSPSWETKSSSASQEIPRILWIPEVHYIFQNSSSPVLIVSQDNPIQSPMLPLNPLNAELNPIFHLLALLGAHHILHVSRVIVKDPF